MKGTNQVMASDRVQYAPKTAMTQPKKVRLSSSFE